MAGKKYLLAAEMLRQRITEKYEPGDCLPAESVLAQELGVSVLTMRRGVELLAHEGLIDRARGRRSVVTKRKEYSQAGSGKNILVISLVKDFFYYELITVIQWGLSQAGYNVNCVYPELEETDGDSGLRRKLESVLNCNKFDAAVVLPVSDAYPLLKELFRTFPVPVVHLGVREPLDGNFIAVDLADGAYMGLSYLHGLGCRNICYLGRDAPSIWERASGLLRFVNEFYPGKNMNDFLVPASGTIESGYAGMKKLLEQGRRIDGVLAHNDLCAVGVVMAAREYKLHIPEDMAVIGFDNIAKAQEMSPPLTTISQPKEKIVASLCRILDQNFAAPRMPIQYNVILTPFLLIRESTLGFVAK